MVPHDQLLTTARQVAATIVGNNQGAVRALLASYHRIDESQTSEGLWWKRRRPGRFRTTETTSPPTATPFCSVGVPK